MPQTANQENPQSAEFHRKSKYAELVREISDQIRSGQLSPGEQLPSFNELRLRWGVARKTAEKIYATLEQDGLISRERRRGVFVAENQPEKRTGMVGFIGSGSLQQHPYYVHLLQGVRRGALKAGVEVLLLDLELPIRWEKIDGIIYQATLHGCVESPVILPRVSLIYEVPWVDSALADDYPGTTQAMEHLFQLGHRRIAFLTQELQPTAMSQQRLNAYVTAFRSWEIDPSVMWKRCLDQPDKLELTWEETGYDNMRRWLREDWDILGCTAILAHNDAVAIGVIAALQEAGKRVPEDVSVVGFDGTEIAAIHRPRLTTVKVPLEEIGARGMALLMQQIDEPITASRENWLPSRLSLPTTLQLGESTAPPPKVR